ncbi:MAG: DNA repair protein [Clostridia bacterium]|nr:DNA repair protein [Clostridia bacterium]
MSENRWYLCIDMKCFFASVECAERGLNPFETCLVVADIKRGDNAICLAITPKMKSLGIKNRCRINDIPKNVKFIDAKPRMKKYIQYAADIYDIYLNYISPDDIHVYSIDEAFLDITSYLKTYKTTPISFAKFLMKEIEDKIRIPATAGVGSNLFLSKVALDISAKKSANHIGFLTEKLFKETLWQHTPLSDFWGISKGTINRLKKYGVYTMEDVTKTPSYLLYKEFGINAELLIDHANGKESCTISDIKNYKRKSRSISTSQILFCDYETDKAYTVLQEMALSCTQELLKRHLIAGGVGIYIGYSKDSIPPSGGSVKFKFATSSYSTISKYVNDLFLKHAAIGFPIRRLGISFSYISDESAIGYDLFTNFDFLEKEKNLELSVLSIKDKFGKNSILRGFDILEESTQKERNKMIGGHNGE